MWRARRGIRWAGNSVAEKTLQPTSASFKEYLALMQGEPRQPVDLKAREKQLEEFGLSGADDALHEVIDSDLDFVFTSSQQLSSNGYHWHSNSKVA